MVERKGRVEREREKQTGSGGSDVQVDVFPFPPVQGRDFRALVDGGGGGGGAGCGFCGCLVGALALHVWGLVLPVSAVLTFPCLQAAAAPSSSSGCSFKQLALRPRLLL